MAKLSFNWNKKLPAVKHFLLKEIHALLNFEFICRGLIARGVFN